MNKVIYESLGTYYINWDLNKDRSLDNPKQIRKGSYWIIAEDDEKHQEFFPDYGDFELQRVYKRNKNKLQGDYLVITKEALETHFKGI